jgi:hypothetical protein
MADDALSITDPSVPTRFANALGQFAGKAREILALIDARLRAALDTLADRKAHWKREVRERQHTYDTADEDDRASAYQALAEAEDCLRDVRHWEGQLRTAAEQYRRRVLETHDLLDQHTPKAQGALRDHTDLLYAYLAVPAPGAGGSSGISASSIGGPTPTAAQVLVSGFDCSPLSDDAAVYALLKEAIPAAHLDPDKLRGIAYVDRVRAAPNGGFVLGETFPLGDHEKIEIYVDPTADKDPKQAMCETIVHEIGHHCHLDLRRRDPLRWIAWGVMFSNTQDRLTAFVSGYARTNSSEDFAESYAAYIFTPKLLARTNLQKYQLLRDHVFSGREYL